MARRAATAGDYHRIVDTSIRAASRCVYCSSALPAGASFCPACGRPRDAAISSPGSTPRLVDMSLWTAMRFGFGFAAGSTLFALFILAVAGLVFVVSRR